MNRLKILSLLVTLFSGAVATASADKRVDGFPVTAAIPFSIVKAQALANAQRVALYGPCGMSIFKEKNGAVWTFETKVGYGGRTEPDISIVEPPVSLPNFRDGNEKSNRPLQIPEPTPDGVARSGR